MTWGWLLPLRVGAAKLGRWGTAAGDGEGGAHEGYPCFWGDGLADAPWGRHWALTAECPWPGLAPRHPASPLQPRLARPTPLPLPQTRAVRARAREAAAEGEDMARALL